MKQREFDLQISVSNLKTEKAQKIIVGNNRTFDNFKIVQMESGIEAVKWFLNPDQKVILNQNPEQEEEKQYSNNFETYNSQELDTQINTIIENFNNNAKSKEVIERIRQENAKNIINSNKDFENRIQSQLLEFNKILSGGHQALTKHKDKITQEKNYDSEILIKVKTDKNNGTTKIQNIINIILSKKVPNQTEIIENIRCEWKNPPKQSTIKQEDSETEQQQITDTDQTNNETSEIVVENQSEPVVKNTGRSENNKKELLAQATKYLEPAELEFFKQNIENENVLTEFDKGYFNKLLDKISGYRQKEADEKNKFSKGLKQQNTIKDLGEFLSNNSEFLSNIKPESGCISSVAKKLKNLVNNIKDGDNIAEDLIKIVDSRFFNAQQVDEIIGAAKKKIPNDRHLIEYLTKTALTDCLEYFNNPNARYNQDLTSKTLLVAEDSKILSEKEREKFLDSVTKFLDRNNDNQKNIDIISLEIAACLSVEDLKVISSKLNNNYAKTMVKQLIQDKQPNQGIEQDQNPNQEDDQDNSLSIPDKIKDALTDCLEYFNGPREKLTHDEEGMLIGKIELVSNSKELPEKEREEFLDSFSKMINNGPNNHSHSAMFNNLSLADLNIIRSKLYNNYYKEVIDELIKSRPQQQALVKPQIILVEPESTNNEFTSPEEQNSNNALNSNNEFLFSQFVEGPLTEAINETVAALNNFEIEVKPTNINAVFTEIKEKFKNSLKNSVDEKFDLDLLSKKFNNFFNKLVCKKSYRDKTFKVTENKYGIVLNNNNQIECDPKTVLSCVDYKGIIINTSQTDSTESVLSGDVVIAAE